MSLSFSLKRPLATAMCAISLATMATAAQAQSTEELSSVVETEAESGAYMGAALVARGDEVLLDQAWGSADLEWDIANTTDTRFRIGSVTKQFTAASILLLQERGALSVDDPIGKHLEGAPDAWPEAWSTITVRDLLQQTSGIPNVTSLDEFGTRKFLPTTQDELIAMFAPLPLEFEPGSQWGYSNSNYILLSRIIETLGGQDYSDFVTDNLFKPLGMTSTGVDSSSAILPRRAAGYSPSAEGVVNAEYMNMAIPKGGGALYSTTGDLLRWHRGLFAGDVLSKASLAQMTTPSEFEAVAGARYAMGLLITDGPEGRAIWHGGGIEGFNAYLGYDPDTKASVVVLANLNGGSAVKLGMGLLQATRQD